MKKIIPVILLLTCFAAHAQAPKLSPEGFRHWTRANLFLEEVKADEDYLKAAQEFEAILQYDKDVPEVYYNLGVVYGQYARKKKKDKEMFTKAIGYLNKYLAYNPPAEEAEAVRAEIIKLETLGEKSNHRTFEYTGIPHNFTIEGEFIDGNPNPETQSIVRFSNGDKFEGRCRMDKWKGLVLTEGTYDKPGEGVIYTGSIWPTGWGWYKPDKSCVERRTRDDVPNCPGSRKFEGTYDKGDKVEGTCYDEDGVMVYKGAFKKDKPTGEFPSATYKEYLKTKNR